MQRTCLKCRHVNAAATGDALEACPSCGAIYSKVERAHAERQAETVAPQADAQPAHAPQVDTSITAKYDAAEQRLTRRTGLGMGAWLLVLLVVVPVIWIASTEERRPSTVSTGQSLQAAQAEKINRDFIQLATMEKRVVVGMTADQVRASWDKPDNVNRTETAFGTSEQWVYRKGNARTNYVYLNNGVVTTFQVSE